MKLKDYAEKLNNFLTENPQAAEFEVVTCEDDEGNGFTPVHNTPCMGNYDGDWEMSFDEIETANAVCLN